VWRAVVFVIAACTGTSHKGGGVLASGQDHPWAIALDDANVYWTTTGTTGGIFTVPKAGGEAIMLASGRGKPLWIAVDATNVYWTSSDQGTVMALPKAGGTPVTLASGRTMPEGIAADAQYVYWVEDTTMGMVTRVPIAGGTPELLADQQTDPIVIAVDGSGAYWIDNFSGDVDTVGPMPPSLVTTLAMSGSSAFPSGMAISAQSVFWTTQGTNQSTGQVLQVAKSGGAKSVLADGEDFPGALATDGGTLYWLNGGFNAGVRELQVGGAAFTHAAAESTARQIAVDDTNVYWTTEVSGTITALPK